MNKTLFLRINTGEVFFNYIKKIDKCNYYTLKPGSFIFKVLNKLNLNNLMFSSWKKKVKEYDLFILGENYYSFKISKYIKRKNKNAKIIMYYLNILNPTYEKVLSDKNIDEFWTFDRNDAKKYNMKYNPQFYSNEIVLKKDQIKNDILYLGRDKGRKEELINLKSKFEENGLLVDYHIIEFEKDFISYDQYLNLISKTKCILDYNQSQQVGLSLRPLESLFFEKKIITNNTDIVNYDFYDSNNVFILGKDNINDIKKFIDKPYKKIDKKIVDYYDYKTWLKRFEGEK